MKYNRNHYKATIQLILKHFDVVSTDFIDDLTCFYHAMDTFLFIRGRVEKNGIPEIRYFVTRIKYNMDDVEYLGSSVDFNESKKLIADYVYNTYIKPAQQFNDYILTDDANLWLR